MHEEIPMRACLLAAVQCSAVLLLLLYIKDVWVCVHSTVNWSGCSLDWMEKGPGREVHTLSQQMGEPTVLPSQGIPPHWACSVGHTPHTTKPAPPRACLNQLDKGGGAALWFLIWPSKPGMGTVGWQGRKGGGVFCEKKSSLVSMADMSLIISTLCSGSVTAHWETCTQSCQRLRNGF